MCRSITLVFLLLVPVAVFAQITQTVRGKVVDAVSQQPLPGATVVLLDSTQTKGTAADWRMFTSDGYH